MSWEEFEINAPGRVNLIGEHTDYNGLPVLPMAIERSICIKGKSLEQSEVHVALAKQQDNVLSFKLQQEIPPHSQGHWLNYVKAGMQGVLEVILEEYSAVRGCRLLIDGTIPQGMGLSSSSAMVVASALALLRANGIYMDPRELAERMAEAEHYVGTRGGGMDQAACLLSKEGHVLKIDFDPLEVKAVPFPKDYTVVICDCLIGSKKSEEALKQYNLRALECRLGTMVLCGFLRKQNDKLRFTRLGDLRGLFSYEELLKLVEENVRDVYSYARMAEAVGEKKLRELMDEYSFRREEDTSTLIFSCGKRLRHVINEAVRVEQCCEALENGDYERLGCLMNQGHASARDDFEISCPELNHLTQLALEGGAIGSRLTGAGFGGCTVNLVQRDKVDEFIPFMADHYYSWVDPTMEIDHCIFSTQPVSGAYVKYK